MAKLLYTVREHRDLSAADWQKFRAQVTGEGHSPTEAIARLIRRYLRTGFDDGQPETREQPEPE